MSDENTPDPISPVPGAGEGEKQPTTPEADAAQILDRLEKSGELVIEDTAGQQDAEPPKPEEGEKKPTEQEKAPDKPEPEKVPEKVQEQPETATPEIPQVLHPYDEADDPTLDEVDPKFTKIRQTMEKQRAKLRKAREEGAFGKTLIEMAQKNGVSPEKLAEQVAKSIKLEHGDPVVMAEIAAELQRRGVTFAQQKQEEPSLDQEAKRIYEEQFASGVKAAKIDEDFAMEQARKMAEREIKSRPQPKPQVQIQPTQQFPPQPAPQQNLVEVAAQRVNALSATIESNYKKIGLDYQPVYQEVQKRIQERVQREGQLPPHLWEYTFSETVRQVQQEQAAKRVESLKQQKPLVKPQNTLTPTTQSNIGKNNGSWKDFRDQLADEL